MRTSLPHYPPFPYSLPRVSGDSSEESNAFPGKVTDTRGLSVARNVLVPKAAEGFWHDADGNLTGDSLWTNTWSAENRLLATESASGVPAAAKRKVEFSYDPLGRRTQKIVSTNNGAMYYPLCTNHFIYDGWNLVAVLGPDSAVVRSFAWGLDLSGTMQGAGGVCGLLWVNDLSAVSNAPTTHLAAHDGNGNVTGLFSAASGGESARYEYGPFGEALRSTGPMAKANPFRFSTKYQDDETDLLYYGYRYYSANLGRWLSQDPIGERGGANLRSFAANDPTSLSDRTGLDFGTWTGHPGYNWQQPPPKTSNPRPPPTSNPGSPNAYGRSWLAGTAADAILGPDSQWTKDMQRSLPVMIDRERAAETLRRFCTHNTGSINAQGSGVLPDDTALGGELGGQQDSLPRRYYPAYFLTAYLVNPTEAFIGSWTRGSISVLKVNCCSRTATIHFHAVNVSGWSSATHYPPVGGFYGGSLLKDNAFGEDGPGHNVSQTFDWDEEISF